MECSAIIKPLCLTTPQSSRYYHKKRIRKIVRTKSKKRFQNNVLGQCKDLGLTHLRQLCCRPAHLYNFKPLNIPVCKEKGFLWPHPQLRSYWQLMVTCRGRVQCSSAVWLISMLSQQHSTDICIYPALIVLCVDLSK